MTGASDFRRVMGLFATGVTVVTAQAGRDMHGMTANAFCSVSLDPHLLLVSLRQDARIATFIRQSGAFAVNVLSADQEDVARHFAGARSTGAAEFRFEAWEGAPRLVGCLGAAACTVEGLLPAGDHTLVLGHVHALFQSEHEHPPLVFWGGAYRHLERPYDVPVEPLDPFARGTERIFYDD